MKSKVIWYNFRIKRISKEGNEFRRHIIVKATNLSVDFDKNCIWLSVYNTKAYRIPLNDIYNICFYVGDKFQQITFKQQPASAYGYAKFLSPKAFAHILKGEEV